MCLVPASKVIALTGLSEHQVREWTTRRGFVPPDRIPMGPGTRTRFSWRSILLLRLISVMQNSFGMQLEASRSVLSAMREILQSKGFLSLWGCSVIIEASGQVWLSDGSKPIGTALTLSLNPHLEVIATEFEELPPNRQLPLFPVLSA